MTFFSSLAWTGISFVLFTALVAIISAWKTRDEQLDTAEGYFLAGRGLPGVVIAGSLLLTNLSAEQLVGLNGQSWKTNMGPIAWEVGSMFTLLVLAYYFLPKYLKMGAMTIPSLMEERYGRGTKTMFSVVIVVMYSILNLPVILYSGAVVFEQIFDISGIMGTSKFVAVAILCVIIGIIGGCYAIFGGLKAVAVSDTINGIGLIIGGLMIPFLGFAALSAATGGHGILDGVKYMIEADPAKMNAINAWNAPEPEVPWPLIITGMFFNNLYWWCTNQSFVQRSLAAKSLKEGQKGAIFCGFLKCLGPLYLVIPGESTPTNLRASVLGTLSLVLIAGGIVSTTIISICMRYVSSLALVCGVICIPLVLLCLVIVMTKLGETKGADMAKITGDEFDR